MHGLAIAWPNPFCKFEVRSFTHSEDTTGSQQLKTSHDIDRDPLALHSNYVPSWTVPEI